MNSARGIAELAVEALKDGDLGLHNDCLVDLEATLLQHRDEVRRHLLDAGIHVAYLHLAHVAAQEGNEERMRKFYSQAVKYVGDAEVAALAEEHRYSFIAREPVQEQPSRPHCEFFC